MTQDPHPYYDSEKRKRYQNKYVNLLIWLVAIVGCTLFGFSLNKVVAWENENKIEIWVEYEVGFQDLDKIIFYKKHDPTDSLVFRVQSNEPFYGTECIHKLEYSLP